jgi:hypothetical protein
VFGNRVLRRIFGPGREELAGGWRRLHSEELHNLYTSQNIITMVKSRSMGWAEHVARMGEMRNAYNILVGNLEVKRPLGRPRRRWKMTEWMIEKEGGKKWTGCILLRIQISGGLL